MFRSGSLIGALLLAFPLAPGASRPILPIAATGPFLTGQLLVAEPHLRDPNFRRTVVLVARHDESGAFGLVINRPIRSEKLDSLLEALGSTLEGARGEILIHFGGPVEGTRGFVLHSMEQGTTPMIPVGDRYGVTSNLEILEAIARGKGPKRTLVTFGYAGWGSGQLEREIERGDWALAPASEAILFDVDHETKWKRALDSRYVQT